MVEEDFFNIIRYKDRKLYKTDTSNYIKYSDIIKLIRLRKYVRVQDFEGKDITLQILVDCYCTMLKESVNKKFSEVDFNKLIFKMKKLIREF